MFLAAKEGSLTAQKQAQCNLGECYKRGEGVEKNLEESIKWYTLAAEGGQPNAQYQLGLFFFHGIGVEKNLKEAVKWFTLSSENEEEPESRAQFILGRCYQDGTGVEQNLKEAVKWLTLAVENGWPPAQYTLALCKMKLSHCTSILGSKGEPSQPLPSSFQCILPSETEILNCSVPLHIPSQQIE